MRTAKYLAVWNSAYHPGANGEHFAYVDDDFFTTDKGYQLNEIKAIIDLQPGRMYEIRGMGEYHVIVRLALPIEVKD